MESLALSGLRWAASPIVNKLLNEASAYLSVDMVRELQQLEATVLPQFDLVIQAAEKSPHRGRLEAWLRRLKVAFYDAEDLLDEYEYNVLKCKAESGEDPSMGEDETSSITSSLMNPIRATKSRLIDNLLLENRKLIDKMDELKDILTEAKELRDLLGLPHSNTAEWPAVQATNAPTTTSLPISEVFGRDKERDHIVDLLCKTTAEEASSTRYSSLAIVGPGGIGKSTLAQYVYNDTRIEECFDVKMWVCISRKLDVHRHTKEIVNSTTNGKWECIDNLDTLQCILQDNLQESKKFLLVLDDVWFEKSDSENEWGQFLAPLLASKQSGSRVLVTSRSEILPNAVSCEVVHLDYMDDTEFLALFKHHAFNGVKTEDQLLHTNLEHIAEDIAKRLGKCPLAAKVLGSQLSRKIDITEWMDVLNLKELDVSSTTLMWSYNKLDPHLQRCFLYCSLFPKGHRYKPDELVHLWVAEGFVDDLSKNSCKRTLEDVGRDYFNDMVSGSFFRLVSKSGFDPYYIMHDILHDLAQRLAREDCFRLEDDNVTEIPSTVRHLSIHVDSMQKHKQIICKLHHLRTIICIDRLKDDASDLFDHVIRNLRKLRVLYLSFYNDTKLHESVGELKHLRYLNLTETPVSESPTSLCTLHHLQFLQLYDKVERLPDKLCNLSKLRNLELEGYSNQIPSIGKLTSLQHLRLFSVQKKQGYELRQLKDLNELGGSLIVENLENVMGKDEALQSKLYQKNRLKELSLQWSYKNDTDADGVLHLDILEGLRPPPQLSNLTIEGYKSGTYPSWLLEASYFENLESFALEDCSLLECLPNLKSLSSLPAGITRLSIERCPLLTFVTKNELEQHELREDIMKMDDMSSKLASIWEMDSGSGIRNVLSEDSSSLKQLMAQMDDDISQHLQIIETVLDEEGYKASVKENIIQAWLYCHEQRTRVIYGRTMELPLVLPSRLRKLVLSSCGITNEGLAICLGGLSLLETLELKYNMTLTALPSEEVFQHLTNLYLLRLQGCWCLRSLGGLRAVPSLSRLVCVYCPTLELGAEFMPMNLSGDLFINGSILAADSFINLPHLESLDIRNCRSSASLSIGHMTSLESLELYYLPDLCFLEGLSSLQLKRLTVGSAVLLNRMLRSEGFIVPPRLGLSGCKELSVSFEEPADLSSVKELGFDGCEMESLPGNLEFLTGLRTLDILNCPNITSLPDLPSSLQYITIWGCDVLVKNCREPDGESWPKISHVRWKDIE